MASCTTTWTEMRKKIFFSFFFLCATSLTAVRPAAASTGTFNVMSYGARADGRTDDTKAFADTWSAACSFSGDAVLVIPAATFHVGQLTFNGPCRNAATVTVIMQGTLLASTDLSRYPTDVWVEFGLIDRLRLTGGGTFDGQGAASWPFNQCPKNKYCKVLPTSVKFINTTNTVVDGIRSVNSKFFHFAMLHCTNFYGKGFVISAPATSPNTDGIHLEGCSGVTIVNSTIGTGDDCVSIGQGNSGVLVAGVRCGPGHGISVGSLGRYRDERDVRGLVVRDSTLTGTMFGVRIKTWQNSPASTVVNNLTFSDIVVEGVASPILIDQTYCPFVQCDSSAPSRVQISDVRFENIRGTTTTPATAVVLRCSKGVPCKNIAVKDVQLNYAAGGVGAAATSASCVNAEAVFSGIQVPPACPDATVGY